MYTFQADLEYEMFRFKKLTLEYPAKMPAY